MRALQYLQQATCDPHYGSIFVDGLRNPIQLSLLRACRQIRHEVHALPYTNTESVFARLSAGVFLDQILTTSQADALRSISLSILVEIVGGRWRLGPRQDYILQALKRLGSLCSISLCIVLTAEHEPRNPVTRSKLLATNERDTQCGTHLEAFR